MSKPRAFPASVIAAAALLSASLPAVAVGEQLHDWATIHNAQFGFSIAYPVDVFRPKPNPHDNEGRVLISPKGDAKLLVGAFPNDGEASLADYRAYILEQNYAGAQLDYDRMSSKWFVISGVHDGRMFYQRVSFTCGGKLINTWAMVYPVAERRLYDRVVEAVAKTYSPGAGASGECDPATVVHSER